MPLESHVTSKHRWWHFLYGKSKFSEIVYQNKSVTTTNHWEICKKCYERTEEYAITTFTYHFNFISTKAKK